MVLFECVLILFIIFTGINQGHTRPPDLIQSEYCKTCMELGCYEFLENHWCCNCGKGERVKVECKHGFPNETICEICPPGSYASVPNNQTQCNISRTCDHLPNTVLVLGDATHDSICKCIPNFFARDPHKSGCRRYRQCPENFGVKTPGNATHDVECEFCELGYCSNETSSTAPCTLCGGEINDTVHPPITTAEVTTEIKTSSIEMSSPSVQNAPRITPEGFFTGAGVMLLICFIIIGAILVWLRKEKKKEKEKARIRSINRKIKSKRTVPSGASPEEREEGGYMDDFLNSGYLVTHDPQHNQDSLFCAIAYTQLEGSMPSDAQITQCAQELRQKFVQHLQIHSESYKERIQNFKMYIQEVAGAAPGDEFALEGMSELLKKNIEVRRTDGGCFRNLISHEENDTIILGIVESYSERHFVSLRYNDPNKEDVTSSSNALEIADCRVEVQPLLQTQPNANTAREHLTENHPTEHIERTSSAACESESHSIHTFSDDEERLPETVNVGDVASTSCTNHREEHESNSSDMKRNEMVSHQSQLDGCTQDTAIKSTEEEAFSIANRGDVSSFEGLELSGLEEESQLKNTQSITPEDMMEEILQEIKTTEDKVLDEKTETEMKNLIKITLKKSENFDSLRKSYWIKEPYQELKFVVRTFLREDEIEDIEKDNERNTEEIKYKWLQKIQTNYGRDLTPEFLLKRNYKYKSFRDDVIKCVIDAVLKRPKES